MAKAKITVADTSTEEKIKEAARKVFLRKGYSATRTRDIAEESGINLALLNYYFRSKEKLFHIVMEEKFQKLFGTIVPILMDDTTTLEKKFELFAITYIRMLSENPDLPLFVLSELRNNAEHMVSKNDLMKLLQSSNFVKQLKEKRPDINPLQFLMSLLGMSIFPFIMQPVFSATNAVSPQAFKALMEERIALIPKWAKAMIKAK
ncbi:MAG: TetR/AcrR family transcriptional regulator [Ferruginibacter sp.]